MSDPQNPGGCEDLVNYVHVCLMTLPNRYGGQVGDVVVGRILEVSAQQVLSFDSHFSCRFSKSVGRWRLSLACHQFCCCLQ